MRRSLLLALVFAVFAAVVMPFFVDLCASPVANRCGNTASTIALYLWTQLAGPAQIMPSFVFRIFVLSFLASYALIWLIGRLRARAIDA
jgi:hypothetical protein